MANNIAKVSGKKLTIIVMLWIICLVFTMLFYLVLLGPQGRLKDDLAAQLSQKNKTYKVLSEAATEEFQAKQKEQIAEMQESFNRFIVDSDSASSLMFDVSRLIDNKKVSALSITSRQKSGPAELPNCKKICEDSVNLSFASQFGEFAKILNALERNEPILFIDEFSIQRANKGEGHKVSMDLTFFITKGAEKKS